MLSLKELSLFYNNLKVMLDAGLTLARSLETVKTSERDEERKRKLRHLLEDLKVGKEFTPSLKKINYVPVFDLPILEAGEKSGKLPYVLEVLSANYQKSAEAERQIRRGLNYPFFLFCCATFVPSFPKLFLGEITLKRYLFTNSFVVVGIVIGAISLYRYFMRSYYELKLAKQRHLVMTKIPFLDSLAATMSLEKFSSSLALMLEAGIPILDAISLAGKTSANLNLELASRRIIAEIKAGKNLSQAVAVESVFTDDLRNSIIIGQESGKLPEMLFRSANSLKSQVNAKIETLGKVVPQIIYFSVVAYVAFNLLGLYVSNTMKLLNMMNSGLD